MANVAFIGLGVMGYPMAGYLQEHGHTTVVYNRTADKAIKWVEEYRGRMASTPREAAKSADIVFICVGNDDDVRSVIHGDDGVLAGMEKGTTIVDHTTTSADLAIELRDACLAAGVCFMDAPVSGGQAGAENGCLTVMCGGEKSTFESVLPVLESYSRQVQWMGEHGQGQRCKMVNQICIAGVLQGLSEALLLAQSAGLDARLVVETLKHGAAGSWQMENRAVTMSDDRFDFGFAIDWMRKDLAICLAEAGKYGLELSMVKRVDNIYAGLQKNGLGRMDTSALIVGVKG
ncbi:NAD(P)-dependent oxidoreductase [Zobellella sp. An-6]|uniref:NAD(P)-dependent oxidoreductase n=1 Tax=Zobellella sp. An-6 TaxID=3400218 RepID=UPI0040416AF4